MILSNYTRQGLATIKEGPARLEAAEEAAGAAGGEIKAFYLLMGRYDSVTIAEAPDDETAAILLLASGGQGNVQTETLRAFNEDELGEITYRIPHPLP